MRFALGLGVLALAPAVCTAGEIILTNYPGNDLSGTVIDSFGTSKAMGFELFEVPILIRYDITLRLAIDGTDVSPRVEIFDDAGMKPGDSVAVLDGPDTFAPGIGDYTFTYLGALSYPQDQPFWLVVSSAAGHFTWLASDPPQEPWSNYGVQHLGAVWGLYPPADPSDTLNTYEIEAWYPAPGTLATLGLGCTALRRRRRT